MGALADALRRLASLVRREELEDRLDDEIRFHVEQQIEKNRRAGMSPDEARRQAFIRFGGVEQMRERTRDEFRAVRIETLARDVRYGLRSLRRHPGFTAMAVLSLAIGIGANATIFGVAHAVLFKQSPFENPETLVNIYETEGGRGFNPMSHPNIEDLRKGTTQVFSGIAASTFAVAPIDRGGTVGSVMGEAVTGGAFALLGITPLIGRAIQPEDDVARGGHPVVMLSHGYWQRAFGGDPQVVGRALVMGGRSYTIVGVAPADYRGGLPAITPAFYVPMTMLDEVMGFESLDQRDFHSFFVKARLAPGVTRVQAEHAASLVAARSPPRGRRDGCPGSSSYSCQARKCRSCQEWIHSCAPQHGCSSSSWDWCCCWRARIWRAFWWRAPSIGTRRSPCGVPWARREARSHARYSSRACSSGLAERLSVSSWRSCSWMSSCRLTCPCPTA